jgi:hypothetical protein
MGPENYVLKAKPYCAADLLIGIRRRHMQCAAFIRPQTLPLIQPAFLVIR